MTGYDCIDSRFSPNLVWRSEATDSDFKLSLKFFDSLFHFLFVLIKLCHGNDDADAELTQLLEGGHDPTSESKRFEVLNENKS